MKFAKQDLLDLIYGEAPEGFAVARPERVADTTRWSVHKDLVFQHGDRFFLLSWSEGATEYQDERPLEFETDEIELPEVEAREVTTIQYVPKGDTSP